MSRLPRLCPPGIALHLMQRGHNRQPCFVTNVDYATYARRLQEAALQCEVRLHAWVFMTNHVHLLVTPAQPDSVSSMMQRLNRNYVGYFNEAHQRRGTLWEGRFKSCLVESAGYLLQCYRYIELNPVRAGMVTDAGEYPWSSYRCNAFGIHSDMLSPHPEYLALARDTARRLQAYRNLFNQAMPAHLLRDIRDATQRNLALGSQHFKTDVEAKGARRVTRARPGPPGNRNVTPTPIYEIGL